MMYLFIPSAYQREYFFGRYMIIVAVTNIPESDIILSFLFSSYLLTQDPKPKGLLFYIYTIKIEQSHEDQRTYK
jgi:hypothetical protein